MAQSSTGMCSRGARILGSLYATALLCVGVPARANTITVDTTADDTTVNGNCTLRESVIAANTNIGVDGCAPGSGTDMIIIPAGTYELAVLGFDEDAAATGDLDVSDDVQIMGSGATATVIDGNGTDRVFDIDPAASGAIMAELSDLTVRGGGLASEGGGIRNQGTLMVRDCVISENATGGVNVSGGGIHNTATLEIYRSTIRDNRAFRTVDLLGRAGGGGIYNAGSLVVIESTIRDNEVGAGLIPGSGGGISSTGPVTLTRSSVSGNRAHSGLNPGYGSGGGLKIFGADAVITNSTITENIAFTSAGIFFGSNGNQTLTIANSTISHNVGAGIDANSGVTVNLRNTIIANNGNVLSGDCSAFSSPFRVTANAYNLDSDGSCGLSGTDLSGVDPLLGPLQDNGGPTLTRTLLAGSPARESGSPAPPGSGATACAATDQRGVIRPQGVRCDIGAVEVEAPAAPTPSVTATPSTTPEPTAHCGGDCDRSDSVAINELVLGVNIVLGRAELAACPTLDQNASQRVEISELVAAVNNALRGCEQDMPALGEQRRL